VTKLLIVDDEEFTVDMLQTFLQFNGYETIGAFNGQDGLVLTQVEHPEIIILDLMLPDIEGYEVCRQIRTYPNGALLPVIVLSARTEAASKERAIQAGANAYLTKPVQFPLLLAELKRLMLAKSTLAVPEISEPTPEPPVQIVPPLPTQITTPPAEIPIPTPPSAQPPQVQPPATPPAQTETDKLTTAQHKVVPPQDQSQPPSNIEPPKSV